MSQLEQYKNGYKALQQEWKKQDPELFYMGRLAYWTFWISTLANKTKDKEVKEKLLKLKDNGISLLMNSKYVQVRKYVPRMTNKLCYKHYGRVRSKSIWEIVNRYNKNIAKCSKCNEGPSDYYTLYSIALLDGTGEEKRPLYIMFTPYLLYKDRLPELSKLESVKRPFNGNEFGKMNVNYRLTPTNLVEEAFSVNLVVKKFKQNYEAAQTFLGKKQKVS